MIIAGERKSMNFSHYSQLILTQFPLPLTFRGKREEEKQGEREKHVFENAHYGPFGADQCDQGEVDPISELLRYLVSNMSAAIYISSNRAPQAQLVAHHKYQNQLTTGITEIQL